MEIKFIFIEKFCQKVYLDSFHFFYKFKKNIVKMQEAIKACSNHYTAYFNLPFSLQKEREVVLSAVIQCGYVIKHVPEMFHNDREIVANAVKSFGKCLKFLPQKWINDREILLLAMENYSHIYKYSNLKEIKEITLLALDKCVHNYKHVHDKFKYDLDVLIVVYKKIKNYGKLISIPFKIIINRKFNKKTNYSCKQLNEYKNFTIRINGKFQNVLKFF